MGGMRDKELRNLSWGKLRWRTEEAGGPLLKLSVVLSNHATNFTGFIVLTIIVFNSFNQFNIFLQNYTFIETHFATST